MNSQATGSFSQSNIDSFDSEYLLHNCEVAKVETSTVHKPTITFTPSQVYVNATLLNGAPEMAFVQFLIDRASQKLILQPCDQRECDSVQLRAKSVKTVKPRHIQSKEFSRRIFEYMHWDFNYRYKVAGSMIGSKGKTLAVFNLALANKFELSTKKKMELQRIYDSTVSLSDSFGTMGKEHATSPLVTQFTEDTVISVEKSEAPAEPINNMDNLEEKAGAPVPGGIGL